MRKFVLLLPFALFAVGCPMMGGNGNGNTNTNSNNNGNDNGNPEARLAGEWDATDRQGRMLDLTFDDDGQLIQIRGESEDGTPVTVDIEDAETELDGSALTITIRVGTITSIFTGTLSDDENSFEGTISRAVELGGNVTITIPQGDLTATRDDDDDDDDDVAIFMATLSGDQETPPVETAGTGEAAVTLSADQTQLELRLTASGLSGPVTNAHIHFAPVGEAGPVVLPLFDFVEEDENGLVTINVTVEADDFDPALVVADLLDGLFYFNLHTAMHPNGEIRGQIIVADDDDDNGDDDNSNDNGNDNSDDDNGNDNGGLPQEVVALYEAVLDGEQEMPPVASEGTGTGSVGLTAEGQFVIQVMASGLTGPVTTAHIHQGFEGIAGDIVLHLTEHVEEVSGMVTINATVAESDFTITGPFSVQELLDLGQLYFNLHTAQNPAGEIRGQILADDDSPGDDNDNENPGPG